MISLISDEYLKRLLDMDSRKKTAALLLIFDRMAPALRQFCNIENRDYSIFQSMWDKSVEHLGNTTSPIDWNSLQNAILDAAPDSEEFGSIEASFSLDAALVAAATVSFIIDEDNSHITESINYIINTLDTRYLTERGIANPAPNSDEYLNSYFPVQKERARLLADINFLQTSPLTPWSDIQIQAFVERANGQEKLLDI